MLLKLDMAALDYLAVSRSLSFLVAIAAVLVAPSGDE
jgi:hypothetical protein